MQATMIAALYVDTDGPYYGVDGIDPWDQTRDARLYSGPHPVIAHPPCNHWSVLANVNAAQYEHFHIGDDKGCFEAALAAVRTFGGVLEHPAHSMAWAHYGLPEPTRHGWAGSLTDPGLSTEVSQVAYGHVARKRTWLYAVGCDPLSLNWTEPQASHRVGHKGSYSGELLRVDPKAAIHTPPAFRQQLIDIVRTAR
jgi:hypothetical protein